MSSRYRSNIRIMKDILETVYNSEGCGPTRILYRANLSHDRLVKYLSELKSKGFLEEKDGGYFLTERGLRLLAELRKIEEFLKGMGIRF
ncbi:hypothetical protein DRN93_05045 [archaeon]|nr:MAG: hypothetical protein DRN93_05045 [archaeon]HDN18050.1 hypothetical protein [Candidatus Bathyarchaeota archaeon]